MLEKGVCFVPKRHVPLLKVAPLSSSCQVGVLVRLLRPDAVSLVDAFNYSDDVLGSYIGAKDGDIYTKYDHLMMYRYNGSRHHDYLGGLRL